MHKVGICGHFGGGHNFLDGQTVKTKILTEELKKEFGNDEVQIVDTHGWRNNPFALLFKCFRVFLQCENIVILPAHNGVRVFVPLFVTLNKLFSRKMFYVVIGGWLPKLLEDNVKLRYSLGKFNKVFVETQSMLENLFKQGLDNVQHLPNFKRLDILDRSKLVYPEGEPYKLCTFSRVMEEKGIEDAIKAVSETNRILGKRAYTLDIYGPIDDNYIEKFNLLKQSLPPYITYKGMVDFNDTTRVLKEYFALLFPTRFKTEGVPGTIIDAYSAGVPVIASQWDSAKEIIAQGKTGFIYDFMQNSKLKDLLLQIFDDPIKINNMKIDCLKKAKQYSPEVVIMEFKKYL
ncbi:glycosyltransferase [Neobacillus drentensis]|uniref:glycosyltransferase family 4 protein n=1 Tax=Neobacillus drentensis TaxID=220684 RepID=UPI002FFEBAB5